MPRYSLTRLNTHQLHLFLSMWLKQMAQTAENLSITPQLLVGLDESEEKATVPASSQSAPTIFPPSHSTPTSPSDTGLPPRVHPPLSLPHRPSSKGPPTSLPPKPAFFQEWTHLSPSDTSLLPWVNPLLSLQQQPPPRVHLPLSLRHWLPNVHPPVSLKRQLLPPHSFRCQPLPECINLSPSDAGLLLQCTLPLSLQHRPSLRVYLPHSTNSSLWITIHRFAWLWQCLGGSYEQVGINHG